MNKIIYKIAVIMLVTSFILSINIKAEKDHFSVCLSNELKKQGETISTIKSIDCSNQSITYFPDLSAFKALKTLDLSNNEINYINHNISSNSKLISLNLSGNTIYYIHSNLNYLTYLKSLTLYSTHLLVLPDISNLTKLEELNISNNQLLISPNLSNNPLKQLNISNNYLSTKVINSKIKSFKIENQNNLYLKKDTVEFSGNQLLYTPYIIFQRTITSKDNIPIYGVNSYQVRNAYDNKGNKVNFNDYYDISIGKIKKPGIISGYIDFIIDRQVYNTNLKVKLIVKENSIKIVNEELKTITMEVIKEQLISNNKSIFDNIKTVKYKDNDLFLNYFTIYILNIMLILILLIPLFIIIYFIRKIDKAKIEIENLQ